ncbi:MAG TPA: CGNR zinc finger domain-containing protein [Burkholderiales bacterium]|nr:CGNR zinc finger domain-containing protein [Burkholderiales bacterium]
MEVLFLGGHPAADFLNTRPTPQGIAVELIGDGAAFLRWLQSAGLVDAASAAALRRRPGQALDAAAAEARALREWVRDWMARWREAPAASHAREMRQLNALLGQARWTRQAIATKQGIRLRESCRLESPEDLVALVAAQIAALVAEESPALVKRCAGGDCNLWFVDRTKAHQRVYCSAAGCGNRAKVAAFRQRQRDAKA